VVGDVHKRHWAAAGRGRAAETAPASIRASVLVRMEPACIRDKLIGR